MALRGVKMDILAMAKSRKFYPYRNSLSYIELAIMRYGSPPADLFNREFGLKANNHR
jgi:hypothetical protein